MKSGNRVINPNWINYLSLQHSLPHSEEYFIQVNLNLGAYSISASGICLALEPSLRVKMIN